MPKRKTTEEEISNFLEEFMSCEKLFVVDEREENKETLEILGITPKHRLEEIRCLKYTDYSQGPSPDHINPAHKVYVFGKNVRGRKGKDEVYIKIKTFELSGEKCGKCLSFHIAERPLNYPFKKRRG